MATCEESKTKTLTKKDCLDILDRKYPEKTTQRRTIRHLWDNYYRINYFFAPTEKFMYTHFVTVNADGSIEELDK